MTSRQTASDLGRRVARRRLELGLTVGELATRTGMSAGYLDHLEKNAAIVGAETLMTLARALKISGWALLGDDSVWPPGDAPAASGAVFRELGEAECWRLISAGGVGRVIAGALGLPVNYALYRGDLVFRTAAGGVLANLVGTEIGFEIDQTDTSRGDGWSVLVIGRAILVTHPAELGQIYRLVHPWAGDDRRLCVRVVATTVTGRRVHAS